MHELREGKIQDSWQCIHLALGGSALISCLFFITGITKTHNLRFQEREALQAVFSSHLCPNVLKASARLAECSCVIEFHHCPSAAQAKQQASAACRGRLFNLRRLLADMVMPFPASQEEITLSVTPLRVSMRNYYEEANSELK